MIINDVYPTVLKKLSSVAYLLLRKWMFPIRLQEH